MKKLLVISFLCLPFLASAQDVKVIQGDLKPLKDASSLKLEFTYNDMVIGDDKTPEQDYIRKKKDDYNAKEAGRGEKWEQAWKDDRSARFEPKFVELFEKYSKKKSGGDAKYTLIFNTTRTEPGWVGVGIVRKNARIDGIATIVETANPSNVIAKIQVLNAPGYGGMGYDWDTGLRLQEAYAKTGKELGRLIAKK